MLLKSNKRILFVLAVLFILILIPCSFASDLNDNETISLDDGDEVFSADDVIYVSNNDNDGNGSLDNPYNSISSAINVYNSSIHSKIYLKDGNYDIDQQITIKDKEINIVGESVSGTVLNANHQNSIFKFDLNSKVTLTNITFKNANNDAAFVIDHANSLNIINCIFDNNLKGVIYKNDYNNNFDLTITDSVFSNNKGESKGYYGAVAIMAGNSVTVTGTDFINNEAATGESDSTQGGALYCGGNVKTIYIDSCNFINNSATRGSAISQYYSGDVYIYNCNFTNNTSPGSTKYKINSSVIYDSQMENKGFSLYLKNNLFSNNVLNDEIEVKNVNVIYTDKNTKITANNVDKILGDDYNYIVALTDFEGNPLANKEITVTLTNNYDRSVTTIKNNTNDEGIVIIDLKSQKAGKYSAVAKFIGDEDWDEASVSNNVLIRTESSYNVGFEENPIHISEGDSYNVTIYIYDEYMVPTNDLTGKALSIDWYDIYGKHLALSVNSVKVEGNKLVYDINRLHLQTSDVAYEVNFDIGSTVSAVLTVDLSKNISNVDPSIDELYVSKSGNDETGDGSRDNPLSTLQTALYANRMLGGGKTIYVDEGTYEISTYTIIGNVTIVGVKSKTILKQTNGVLGMLEMDNGTTVKLINLTFIDGYATPSPDALLHVADDTIVYIEGCEFTNNSAIEGGTISVSTGGKVYIDNSYFHDNKAILGRNGGTIYVDRGYLYISNSLFEDNFAGDGGAIYLGFPAEALIVNTTFINNTANGSSNYGGSGGAIFSRSSNFTVENSTFIENTADYGGAIFIDYGATNVYRSYFENNRVTTATSAKGSQIQGSYISYCNLTMHYSILISEESNSNLYLVYIPNIDENYTADVNYNFWKTNSIKTNVESNYSVQMQINLENEFVYTGDIVEFTINFVNYNADEGTSPLDGFVHDFDVKLIPTLGLIEDDIVTIKNNKAVFYYNATTVGEETIRAGNIFQLASYKFDVLDGSDKIKLNPTITVDKDKKSTITVTFDQSVTGNITIRIGEDEYQVEINDSKAILKIDTLPGDYVAKIIFRGDENFRGFVENVAFNVAKYKSIITIDDATLYYNGDYQAKLTDDEGNVITGEKLTLIINETSYEAITDENGIAIFELNLPSTGSFDVEVTYLGNTKYNESSADSKINLEYATVKLTSKETTYITPIKGEYSVTLTDNKNSPLKNTKVIFTFNSEIFEIITDDNGIATLELNNNALDIGEYDISAEVEATAVYSGDKAESKIMVQKAIAILNVENITVFANHGEFKVTVTDEDGNPLDNYNVSVKIANNDEKIITTNVNGTANFTLSLTPANYTVITKLSDNKIYDANEVVSRITVKESIVNIIAPEVIVYYSNGKFTAILQDVDGIPISNERLIISIDNDYLATTDENGIATVNINNLAMGTYVVVVKFEGNDIFQPKNVTSTIKVISSISANDMIRAYNSPYDFQAILKDSNGNPVANETINLVINGKAYTGITDNNGILNFASKLAVGTYAITVTNPATGEKTSNYAVIVKRLVENKDFKMYFGANTAYKVRVMGDDGQPVGSGEIVKISVAGKIYSVKTDKNGYASYNLKKLKAKSYTITATYKGVKVSNKIVIKPVLTTKNISKKKAKKIKYSAKLVNTKGKALKGKKITFKVKGKTYKAKTNKKGVAKVTLKKLKVGKNKITIKYGKSTIKKTIKIKK